MTVKIETVEAFNVRKKAEWILAIEKWQTKGGHYPNIGCFCWLTRQGNIRKTGYVLSRGNISTLTKTEKDAVALRDTVCNLKEN